MLFSVASVSSVVSLSNEQKSGQAAAGCVRTNAIIRLAQRSGPLSLNLQNPDQLRLYVILKLFAYPVPIHQIRFEGKIGFRKSLFKQRE